MERGGGTVPVGVVGGTHAGCDWVPRAARPRAREERRPGPARRRVKEGFSENLQYLKDMIALFQTSHSGALIDDAPRDPPQNSRGDSRGGG